MVSGPTPEPGSLIWTTGYLYGLGFFLGLLHWIPQLSPENLVYRWIMWPSLLLMSLYLAIFIGVAFWAACLLARRRRVPLGLLLPAAWTLGEWARAQGVLGFSWGSVGYVLAEAPVLLQSVEIVGIYGLSFVVMGVCGLLSAPSWRGRVPGFALAGLLLLHGSWRLSATLPDPDCDVALVQPNFLAGEKWDPSNTERVFNRCMRQSEEAVGDTADLLIWPETATPFQLRHSPAHLWRVRRWIEAHDTALLTGTPDAEWVGDAQRHYNAALLFNPGTSDTLRYIKRHLVPFSEWLPWRFLRLMEINFGQADFTPGTSARPLAFGDHAAGVLICIEAIYPRLVRAQVREGADLLVNITNDVWFGNSPAPYQHARMALVRAVEFRRPLVRCANTGISMIVDRTGRVRERLGMFVEGTLRAKVRPETPLTFYARVGDWIVPLSAGVLLFGLFRRRSA